MMNISKRQETLLLIIWTQSLIAMFGSLYYSEVIGYTPCELCWYQRIIMYPLVIIYGVSLLKKDVRIALPGLILSGLGLLLAAYHYSLQKISFMQASGGFCGDVPCTLQYTNYFGFITIPFLSLLAFVIVFVLHILMIKWRK